MPVGAYGGRADVMRTVSPSGPVYQAGTLSGNPLAMACGIATLEVLKRTNPYPRLESETERLAAGLAAAASRQTCRTPSFRWEVCSLSSSILKKS